MSIIYGMTHEERIGDRDFSSPPVPETFALRLATLENLSVISIEEFAFVQQRWIYHVEQMSSPRIFPEGCDRFKESAESTCGGWFVF